MLEIEELKKSCPVKWHHEIPPNGISLGVADVDFEGPNGIIEFIKSNLSNDFSFYQNQSGLDPALKAANQFLKNQKNVESTLENIQIIEGTMMGIFTVMKWISEYEGELSILNPIYEPIHKHATDNKNKINWVQITEKGLDLDQLADSVNRNTKMIVMCNPVNPIGHVFTKSELNAIKDLAIDYDVFVFSDELYEPLVFDKNHTSVAALDDLNEKSLLLYGFSKAYGLAGLRSGFMFVGSHIEEIKGRAYSQMVSPSPISSLVCEFALTDFRSKNWVEQFREKMQLTTQYASLRFKEEGYECNTPSGCFFVFPNIGVDDLKLENYLLDNLGVQIIAGSKFGPTGKNHIRVNCATSEERLDEGINRIIKGIKSMPH